MSLLVYFLLFIAQYDVTWLCVCVVCVCVCLCGCVVACCVFLWVLCVLSASLGPQCATEARSPLLILKAVHKYQMALTVAAV